MHVTACIYLFSFKNKKIKKYKSKTLSWLWRFDHVTTYEVTVWRVDFLEYLQAVSTRREPDG